MTATENAEQAPIGLGRHLRPQILGDLVLLFSESGVTQVSGSCAAAAAVLLDGSRTFAEIVHDRPADIPEAQMASTLTALLDARLAMPRAPHRGTGASIRATPHPAGQVPAGHVDAYWDAAALPPPGASACRVQVRSADGAGSPRLEAALRAADLVPVGTGTGQPDAELTVVTCADYLDPALADIAAELRASGRTWLLARPVGTRIWIGPWFTPVAPGCWRCLSARMWRHRQAERVAALACSAVAPAPRPAAATACTAAVAANLIAHEVAKFAAGARHEGQRAVWTLDTLTLHGEHHAMPVDPHCPCCGTASPPDPTRTPPALRPQTVRAGAEDYRAGSAVHLFESLKGLVSPVTGIVSRLCSVVADAGLGHSYRAVPGLDAVPADLRGLHTALRRQSGGNGDTAEQAMAVALCEALERYSGDHRGHEPRVRGSLRALGEPAVDPRECLLYAPAQYADRARWNADHPPDYAVPEPFDPDEDLDWTPLWSLTGRRWRLLPTVMLYYGARAPSASLRADSNGCAAGSCLEEAILYGLLEVIERDAVAQWWYGRAEVPALDLDGWSDPAAQRARALHERRGRTVWLLDVTTDTGVPGAVAVSRRTGGGPEDIVFGFGAHLSTARAARRALAEVNQTLHMAEPQPGGGYRNPDPVATAWWRAATVAEHRFLAPAATTPVAVHGAGAIELATGDLLQDVQRLSSTLAGLGRDVLVLDQTRPEVGLPVVKVVVPGMRPLTPSFAAGRLFDVPPKLGRRAPRPADLNPIPMFL